MLLKTPEKPQSTCSHSAAQQLYKTQARCYFATYALNSYFLHTSPSCFNTLTSLLYSAMLHLPPLHHISLHVQNLFPILQFSFGHSLPLRQNQISVRFPLPGIFLFDKVMAQLIRFLFFFRVFNFCLFAQLFFSFISFWRFRWISPKVKNRPKECK